MGSGKRCSMKLRNAWHPDMKSLARAYGQALYRATAGLPEREAKEAVRRFVEVLAARYELGLAPHIIDAVEQEGRKTEGIRDVHVTAAAQLPEEQKERLKKIFIEAFGAKIETHWKTDPALLGGAIIRCDDTLLDASLKGRLERLKQQLT